MSRERRRTEVITWPSCRCGWHPHSYFWNEPRTHERGEPARVPICKKPGADCYYWHAYPYTPLRKCDGCGQLGGGNRIKHRHDCFDDEFNRDRYLLCMACWNRLRPLVRRWKLMQKCQALVNKIRRKAAQPRRT